MKPFSEYIEEKDDQVQILDEGFEILNERGADIAKTAAKEAWKNLPAQATNLLNPVTLATSPGVTPTIFQKIASFIGSLLGLGTVGVVGAWGASLLIKGGVKAFGRISNSIKQAKGYKISQGDFTKFVSDKRNSPAIQQATNKMEQKRKKYEDALGEVYKAIEEKDYDLAREEYVKVSPTLRANPEVTQTIIEEITKAEGEPPIWTQTPGNATYKAIRKVTGDVKIAKAAAMAVQMELKKIGGSNGE